jgi:hypothetical protein
MVEAPFDRQYLCADVPMAELVGHQNWLDYLVKNFNKPGLRILEVGSREVTGKSVARTAFLKPIMWASITMAATTST